MTLSDKDIKFIKAVRQLVADNPDFVYEPIPRDSDEGTKCVYIDSDTGCGSCLIGQAALAVGIPRVIIQRYEEQSAMQLLNDCGYSYDVSSWASSVQHAQDQGREWSSALSHADDEVPDIAEVAL